MKMLAETEVLLVDSGGRGVAGKPENLQTELRPLHTEAQESS